MKHLVSPLLVHSNWLKTKQEKPFFQLAETMHLIVCTHAFSDWFEIITHNYTHLIWHFSPSHTESRLESVAIMCCCVGRVIKPEANIRPSRSQSQSSVCPSHAPSTHTSTSLQYIFSRWLSFQMTVPGMFPGEVRSSQSWTVFLSTPLIPPKKKNHAFNIFIKSNEHYTLHAQHPFCFTFAQAAVPTHEFDCRHSILGLQCMKRRVYSSRGRPLADLLMGYGPQVHLFQHICHLGSAAGRRHGLQR